MSQELSVFGGSEKEFISIYKKSKQEPFDFCFLNIQDLTARRNFEEQPLWDTSKKTSDVKEKSTSSDDEENKNNSDEENKI
jgi:hypothetical protein